MKSENEEKPTPNIIVHQSDLPYHVHTTCNFLESFLFSFKNHISILQMITVDILAHGEPHIRLFNALVGHFFLSLFILYFCFLFFFYFSSYSEQDNANAACHIRFSCKHLIDRMKIFESGEASIDKYFLFEMLLFFFLSRIIISMSFSRSQHESCFERMNTQNIPESEKHFRK